MLPREEAVKHLSDEFAGMAQAHSGQWLGFREKPDALVGCWKQAGVILHFDIEPCERWEKSWTPRPVRFEELQVGEWFEHSTYGRCHKIQQMNSCFIDGINYPQSVVAVDEGGKLITDKQAFPACQVTRAQSPGADQ